MERLQDIRMKYQSIADQVRNARRMAAVIDFLFSRPILSVRQASDGLGIPFMTAGDYLTKLERAGVLKNLQAMPEIAYFRQMKSCKLYKEMNSN